MPLDLWKVWLESGHTVEIAAHGASEREGWITFKALVKGPPNREITVAAFPTLAVADWEGGAAFDGLFAHSRNGRAGVAFDVTLPL